PLVASFNNAISQIEKRINNLKLPAGMFGSGGNIGGGFGGGMGGGHRGGGPQNMPPYPGNIVSGNRGVATAALQERSNTLLQNILTELQRQNTQMHLNNLKNSGVPMSTSGYKGPGNIGGGNPSGGAVGAVSAGSGLGKGGIRALVACSQHLDPK